MYRVGAWYAIRVRREMEFNVARGLTGKGYEVFLPRTRATRRTSGALQECEVALFPGYLFCQISPHAQGNVITTPGVVAFVTCGGRPVELDSSEVRSLQQALACTTAQPHPYVRVGERVRIDRGALSGVEGVVLRTKDRYRLVITITMLQRAAAVEVDAATVIPLLKTA